MSYTKIISRGSISNWLTLLLLVAMPGGQLKKMEMEGDIQMPQRGADPNILLLRRQHSDMPTWRLTFQIRQSMTLHMLTVSVCHFGLDSWDAT